MGQERRDCLVIVPTYNEIQNLPIIIEQVLAATGRVDILIVDDNSPDGTGAAADAFAAANERVFVRHRSGKLGLGTAYLEGFAWGLDAGYDYVIEMDADGSHPPESLPGMIDAAEEGRPSRVGLVIGSRWIDGGAIEDWPRRRETLSRMGNGYARVMLGLNVHDATAGYRVYTADALRGIDREGLHAHGYIFQVGMTVLVADAGFGIVEMPITFRERRLGTSKMSGSIVAEAMVRVTAWGVRRRVAQLFGRTAATGGTE